MSDCQEIIDLTNSFTLSAHHSMTDIIIELNDSLDCFPINNTYKKTTNRKTIEENKLKSKPKYQDLNIGKLDLDNNRIRQSSKWGECPICWDVLGKNSLASTKCGHVYCLKCLEHSLRVEKKCPTCRRVLKGSSAYHPLYLC